MFNPPEPRKRLAPFGVVILPISSLIHDDPIPAAARAEQRRKHASPEEHDLGALVSDNKPRAAVNEGVDQEFEPSFRGISPSQEFEPSFRVTSPHTIFLALILHENKSNEQDKSHAHIAQTPRKTRTTGGITRAHTYKIKIRALLGYPEPARQRNTRRRDHIWQNQEVYAGRAITTQKHRMSSHRRRDNAPSQLQDHVVGDAGSHGSAPRRNTRRRAHVLKRQESCAMQNPAQKRCQNTEQGNTNERVMHLHDVGSRCVRCGVALVRETAKTHG